MSESKYIISRTHSEIFRQEAMGMTDGIGVGTLLLKDGALTPQPLQFSNQPCAAGWSAITNATCAQLSEDLNGAGWTFFYMAGEIHANGFGMNAQSRMNRALTHLIGSNGHERCNCLEITQIRQRSFLGLRYISLAARSRHVQKSRSFEAFAGMPFNI